MENPGSDRNDDKHLINPLDTMRQDDSMPRTVRVAVTQAEPEWLDLEASVEKTCRLMREAASNGAQLISFPECWLPGYPAWIWSRPVDVARTRLYIQNSLCVESTHMGRIKACARENKLTVALGFSENHHNSLYISQCTISDRGELLIKRRKYMPTHMERTIFGNCTGNSLDNVVSTAVGNVGQLACWEHIQPLLKYHTLSQREAFHIAAWPPVHEMADENELWSMSRDGTRSLSRTYAIESQSFVLHTTALITQKGIDRMHTSEGGILNSPGGGSSAIYGPDGRQLSQDLGYTQEGIIYGDLTLDAILDCKAFVDTVGHYSRPDLLWLGVDKREKLHCRPESGSL